jgi:ABC-type multidrug transport system ATPase subunit
LGEPALEIEGITMGYGDRVAVRDRSLDVQPGEAFGFVGNDGAGPRS